MKYVFIALFLFSGLCLAQTAPAPAPTSTSAAPATLPDQAVNPALLPPAWLGSVLTTVETFPVVGPVIVTAVKWLGVIASLLTLLVTFLLGAIKVLAPVLDAVKLAALSDKVEAFETSTVMYWLKYLSIYNAQAPVATAGGAKSPTPIKPAS